MHAFGESMYSCTFSTVSSHTTAYGKHSVLLGYAIFLLKRFSALQFVSYNSC